MKHLYLLRTITTIVLFLFYAPLVFAQPVGANMGNPVNAGTLIPGVAFSDTKNNSTYNGYGNDMGQPSDDIYYKFTLGSAAEVSISHCSSGFDTYLHLLDMYGNIIISNDDNGPLCATLQSSIKSQLSAGTYYAVSEGYYTNSGNITTVISIPGGSTEVSDAFSQRMNYVFSPLEKNRVPYGLLRDYAMEFVNLENYSGTALTDSNVVDYAAYWDIYQTLFTSRIHSNAGTWKHPTLLDSLWFQQRIPGRLALAGLCIGYGKFKPDAASDNLVTVSNDQIYDRYSGGNWINPYDTDVTFALTPAVEGYHGRRFEVILPSSTWLSNQSVSSIQLNPNDGAGYRTLSLDQPAIVQYADTGIKTWTYRVNLSDGRILYSHSKIHIDFAVDPADDQAPSQYNTSGLSAGPQGITASESFEGQTAQGFITIRYANPNDPQLRRPLIVAEGFDPGHIIEPEAKYGVNDINQFNREITDADPSVLREILINNPQYDIVYVDWKKGTDNIFRNAKLLKDVIRLINQNKVLVNGVKEPNVVLGQSMGGLISRIALKEMENAGENHETRLFISHDSPHQGANFPVAFQHLARHARNVYISTGTVALGVEVVQLIRGRVSPLRALSLSNQPASRQMLITYINDFGNLDNSVHNSFQQQLLNMGYPQTRNVSLSNGSECAESQGFLPGASLVSYVGKANTRFLGDLAFSGLSYFALKIFPASRIFGLGTLPGRNEFRVEMQLNSVVSGGNNRVYYSDVRFIKQVLYLIPVNVVLAHKEKYAPSGILPYDSYPGGSNLIPSFQSSTYQNWFFKYSITASNQPSFNFVPTVSSLDIGAGSTTLSDSDFRVVYSSLSPPASPKQTPFANFIVAHQQNVSLNEGHISFDRRNADFAGIEIRDANNTRFDCSALCSEIPGPVNFCSSQIYSINNLPVGGTVTWSVSPSGIVNASTSGNSVTLTRITDGSITLTANIISSCGNTNISKAITVGLQALSVSSYVDRTPQFNDYQYLNATAEQLPGTVASNYKWYQETNGVRGSQIASGLQLLNYPIPPCATVYYQCVATTACGEAVYRGYAYNTNCGSYAISGSLVAYPNPANTELNINNREEASDAAENGTLSNPVNPEFQVKLYDGKGNILRSAKNPKGNRGVRLDIAEVPDDTYYLHITKGKEVFKKQIIINHQQ